MRYQNTLSIIVCFITSVTSNFNLNFMKLNKLKIDIDATHTTCATWCKSNKKDLQKSSKCIHPFIPKLYETRKLLVLFLNNRYTKSRIRSLILSKDTIVDEAFNSMIAQRLRKSMAVGDFLQVLGQVGIAIIIKNDGYHNGLLYYFNKHFGLKLTPCQLQQAKASDNRIEYRRDYSERPEFKEQRAQHRRSSYNSKKDKEYMTQGYEFHD